MTKLVTLSLQTISPFTSEYTKGEITSDEEISKTTKSFCITRPCLSTAWFDFIKHAVKISKRERERERERDKIGSKAVR